MIKYQNNYCIVGFGNHAKTKLLPALLKLGKPILGVVSSKKDLNLPYKIFKTLNDALNKSNEKTIFVVSSPPQEHYMQVKLLLKFKKNILIEKPIFTHPREVKLIEQDLNNTNVFVAEMLMYKFTLQYVNVIS